MTAIDDAAMSDEDDPAAMPPDEQLMLRYYNCDDDDAYEALFGRHLDRLTRFARTLIGNSQIGLEPEDAAAETLAKVVHTQKTGRARWVEGKASVHTWLNCICIRIISAKGRRKGRSVPSSDIRPADGDLEAILPAELVGPFDVVASQEIKVALGECQNALPPEEWAVIHCIYWLRLTEAECARHLEVPPTTVWRRHKRALARLMKCLANKEFLEP